MIRDKLHGFPPAYYVTLEESGTRQQRTEWQFGLHGVRPVRIASRRFSESDDRISGRYVDQIISGVYAEYNVSGATLGCLVSHFKAISLWLNTSTSDFAFFCEDDLSLETVSAWNFSWMEFVSSLPRDWEALQLLVIRDEFGPVQFRRRLWDDWAHTAYLLRRSYAEKLVRKYVVADEYRFDLDNENLIPLGENVLFTEIGTVYSFPLFVEDVGLGSTFSGEFAIASGQKYSHVSSCACVRDWWSQSDGSLAALYLAGRP